MTDPPAADVRSPLPPPRARLIQVAAASAVVVLAGLAVIGNVVLTLRDVKPAFSGRQDVVARTIGAKYAFALWYRLRGTGAKRASAGAADIAVARAAGDFGRVAEGESLLVSLRQQAAFASLTATRIDVSRLTAALRGAGADATTEAAFWEAYAGTTALTSAAADAMVSRLAPMRLGWYDHLARYRIYSRAGLSRLADAQLQAADTSAVRVLAMLGAELILLPIGVVCLICGIGVYVVWRHDHGPRQVANHRVDPTRLSIAFCTWLVAYAVCPAVVVFALRTLGVNTGRSIRGHLMLQLAIEIVSVAIAVWVLWRLEAVQHLRDAFAPERLGARLAAGIGGYVALAPVVAAAAVASQYLFRHYATPTHPAELYVFATPDAVSRWLIVALAVIVAPIVEETMFRGLLYPALRQRLGVVGGIALSATVFGLLHPTLPAGFLPIAVLGAGFAVAYEMTGSLLPGIVMHALQNGIVFALMYSAASS